jgi:tRNA threonylcarbamoyladenosine biosynthesis protein TsaB
VILLAFDSSAAACSVALRRDGVTLARERRARERGHAEALVPLIEATLAQAAVRFEDLDAVATTIGPGSFTGVRIALATAHGLSLALGIPAFGVTTFEAVALAARRALGVPASCLVVLETKRADVYAQVLPADGGAPAPPVAVSPFAVAEMAPEGRFILAGDGAHHLRPYVVARDVLFAPGPGSADAADVAELAARRFASGAPDAERPLPLYVSPPGVTRRPDRTARSA